MEHGICNFIHSIECSGLILEVLTYWPKYSGNMFFPIPSEIEGIKPVARYFLAGLWEGKQLDLRIEAMEYVCRSIRMNLDDLAAKTTAAQNFKLLHSQALTSNVGDESVGICGNLVGGLANLVFTRLITKWPKYSGSLFYPIPSTNEELDVKSMYSSLPSKWEGGQLELRIEALEFVIDELEKELQEYV